MRRPPEAQWLCAIEIGRHVYGKSWRRRLERWFGLARGDLRATIDRPMSVEDLRRVDDGLIRLLLKHEEIATAKIALLAGIRDRIERERDDREIDARAREFADTGPEITEAWLFRMAGIESDARIFYPEAFLEGAA